MNLGSVFISDMFKGCVQERRTLEARTKEKEKKKCQVCSEKINSKRKMQSHIPWKHSLGYGEYCLTHGDPTVSQVMHRCKICSVQFPHNDMDAFSHLKKHGIDRIDYFSQYIMDVDDANGK